MSAGRVKGLTISNRTLFEPVSTENLENFIIDCHLTSTRLRPARQVRKAREDGSVCLVQIGYLWGNCP